MATVSGSFLNSNRWFAALQPEIPAAPQAAWQDMVPRFRALRESIVHLGEEGPFRCIPHASGMRYEYHHRARDCPLPFSYTLPALLARLCE